MQIVKSYWYQNDEIRGYQNDSPLMTRIPKTFKRRLGYIGFNVLSVMNLCAENTESDDITWVVASRHGDTNRMIHLFQNVCEQELLSPTDFSMSVHNALPGMHSIKTKNTSMHTAISAGEHTFALGLLEAYVLSKTTKHKVGYLYYDFQLPDVYSTLQLYNQESCIIGLILENSHKSNLTLEYNAEKQNQEIFNINSLVNFFYDNNDICIIPMPSGQFTINK
jgi:hypothetical protein